VPLYEVPLAKELGVSRTPVREAIGQLVAEGVLDDRAGRGIVVAQPTRQDIMELYDLREALETHAVGGLAVRGLLPQDCEAIRGIVGEMRDVETELKRSRKTVLEGELLQRFVNSDLRFHMSLLQAAGNRRLMKVINNTRLLLRIFTFRREHHTVELVAQVHTYHREILEAVVKKEADNAIRGMREHIRKSLSERLAEYQEEWTGLSGAGLDLF
jgi:DNA-binding GntR family transcriptional regulator